MIELLEHNKETYKRLCDVLEDNNKCALVQATGTGKSYIAGKYIEEYANKALILVPTNAMADAWSDLLREAEKEVDIITYQSFAREPHNFLDYDLVIADEMHHLGSDVWGKKFVETYLQSENHKVIGLTATEIRYLDNSRDMAEEIFENMRIDGCDLPTAINTGVLPTFKYVSALYCDESDFDEWREKAGKIKDIKTQSELKGRLDVCIKNMVSVKQAVNENLTDDYKKIIVFLNNVESKEAALEMFRDVFPTANFYDVDYSKQRTANNEQISRFKTDSNRAVLFAVDMLNEGIHIKGTDCVIMFRKTVSPQVYLQQLGRGLASGTDKTPVIFDFVSNLKNIEGVKQASEKESKAKGIIERFNSRIAERKIIVKNYSMEIENVIDEISLKTIKMTCWTEDEDTFLKENFKSMNYREISNKLNRTMQAVYSRASDLGLLKHMALKDEEKKFLLNNGDMKHSEIAKCLGITIKRVQAERAKLGITKIYKSDEIREYIMKNYKGTSNEKEIAELFGIKEKTVRIIAHRLKKGERKGQCFSEEEFEYVRKNYRKISNKDIAKNINRPVTSVSQIARKLGIAKKGIKIVQLSKENEFIAIYDTLKDACSAIGKEKGSTNIGGCAKKKNKTAYGYKWLYEEDYKKMIEGQKAGEV